MGLLFKTLADGVVAGDRTPVIVAAVLLAVAGTFQNAGGRYVLLLVADIHDRATLTMNRDLMRIVGRTPGLEHHERPDYLDRMALLREDTRVLADALRQAVVALVLVVRVVTTALLLASVHPVLLLPAAVLAAVDVDGRPQPPDRPGCPPGHRGRGPAARPPPGPVRRRHRRRPRPGSSASGASSPTGPAPCGTAGGGRWPGPSCGRRCSSRRAGPCSPSATRPPSPGSSCGPSTARPPPATCLLVVVLAAQVNGQVGQSRGSARQRRSTPPRRSTAGSGSRTTPPAPPRPPPGCEPPCPLRRGHLAARRHASAIRGPTSTCCTASTSTCPAGKSVAIVGENGAGKTTLVKLLCRFYAPTSGTHHGRRRRPPDARRGGVAVASWPAASRTSPASSCCCGSRSGVGDLPRIDDGPRRRRRPGPDRGGRDGGPAWPTAWKRSSGEQFGGAELSTGQWQKVAVARGSPAGDAHPPAARRAQLRTRRPSRTRTAGALHGRGSRGGGQPRAPPPCWCPTGSRPSVVPTSSSSCRTAASSNAGTHAELVAPAACTPTSTSSRPAPTADGAGEAGPRDGALRLLARAR